MIEAAFNEGQAALYLGARPATLRAWRKLGNGPKYYKAGKLVRYRKEELDAFIAKNSFGG